VNEKAGIQNKKEAGRDQETKAKSDYFFFNRVLRHALSKKSDRGVKKLQKL